MNLFKKTPKCKLCGDSMESDTAILRVNTSEGLVEIEVCASCSRFFDMSTEVLLTKGQKTDD